ncbi:uncharacterized protein LOC128552367 [Mercenaria mercenaria]|uniref:uncharacterized protein LOC128552367 n=1 Tax=Mercenaria mercenaria TaxID=6596 RepID=UPI00234E46BB|nr:uncharacterized protein LOC128552367 [Mercenaria mercenaria]
MLEQVETCFSMLGIKLNIDEQRLQGKLPPSEEEKGQNNAKEEKINRSSDASDIHTNKIRQMEKELNSAKKSVQALKAENTNLQEEAAKTIQDLQAENTKQKRDMMHLHTEIDRLYPKLKSHNRLTTPVQFFYQRTGGMIDSVQKELTSILAGYLPSVRFERCERTDDIDPNKILLVFCINASRLGTEAANAIEGIKVPSIYCICDNLMMPV